MLCSVHAPPYLRAVRPLSYESPGEGVTVITNITKANNTFSSFRRLRGSSLVDETICLRLSGSKPTSTGRAFRTSALLLLLLLLLQLLIRHTQHIVVTQGSRVRGLIAERCEDEFEPPWYVPCTHGRMICNEPEAQPDKLRLKSKDSLCHVGRVPRCKLSDGPNPGNSQRDFATGYQATAIEQEQLLPRSL